MLLGGVAPLLLAFLAVGLFPDPAPGSRPTLPPPGPLAGQGPIFWGALSATIRDRTDTHFLIEETTIGGLPMRQQFRRLPPRPSFWSFGYYNGEQRPGPHELVIRVRLEGARSPLEVRVPVRIVAGFECQVDVWVMPDRLDVGACVPLGSVERFNQ